MKKFLFPILFWVKIAENDNSQNEAENCILKLDTFKVLNLKQALRRKITDSKDKETLVKITMLPSAKLTAKH